MTGGHKTIMKLTIFWGIFNICLNIMLVPRIGIIGAALSTAFCISVQNIIAVWIAYNRLSILTLAKGLKFDIVFAAIVAVIYLLFNYKEFPLGQHLLLISSLAIYILISIVNGDLPWRYVFAKYNTE